MSIETKASILDAKGNPIEVVLRPTLYREAHDANLSVGQYLEQQFGKGIDAEKQGTVMEQLAVSSGLIFRADRRFGLRAPTMKQIYDGTVQGVPTEMNAGVIVRDGVPASRIIFPAVILEMIENGLRIERDSQPAFFEQMIAINDSIAGNRMEQPVVNYTVPEGARHQGIAQGSLPPAMMTLSVSEVSRKIPTFSLGLEITDEALKATTLDFVTLSLRRQAEVERDVRVEEYIKALVAGDADMGQAALSSVTSDSLHNATAAGALSHTAWMKFLYRKRRKCKVSHVLCTLDTALKIENREGKPTINTDDPNSPRIDTLQAMLNPGVNSLVKVFLVDSTTIANDTIVALDNRYAIRRVRNTEADYQATEQFVLRKMSALRFDFGEIVYRLFDDAWDVMTISA